MRRRHCDIVKTDFFFGVCVCGGGEGGNAYRARRLSHNGTFRLRRTRRAATRRTAQISRHLPHTAWPEYVWMLSFACCMLHVACHPSLVACCMLPPQQAVSARTHARAERARAHAHVGMAVADEVVGRTPLVICAFTLHWPQLPRHTLCTAAAPHPSLQSSVGLQLRQITTAGTEKALLADVTAAHPDASYIELLRLFKVRRSVADGHVQPACCIVPAARCPCTSAHSRRT